MRIHNIYFIRKLENDFTLLISEFSININMN